MPIWRAANGVARPPGGPVDRRPDVRRPAWLCGRVLYECRNRDGAVNGELSAHAVGQAVDISGFELSNGKLIPVKPDGDEAMRELVDSARTAACGWFTPVLGPGADAAHTDHMHVDIAMHGTSDRYRICQ